MIKCKKEDFEINCQNSDAECFVDGLDEDTAIYVANDSVAESEGGICENCVYNVNYKDYDYAMWLAHRANIGIEPK